MSKTAYRNRRIVISDSEDSEPESDNIAEKQGQSAERAETCVDRGSSSFSPSPSPSPGPSCPRVSFAARSIPLTPRRTVAFAPTPIKNVNFSLSKSTGKGRLVTPARKMGGLRLFVQRPSERRLDPPDGIVFGVGERCRSDELSGDVGVDVESLDMGSLKLSDPGLDSPSAIGPASDEYTLSANDGEDTNEDELADVDGVLSFSPSASIETATPTHRLFEQVSPLRSSPTTRHRSSSFSCQSLNDQIHSPRVKSLSDDCESPDHLVAHEVASDSDSDAAWLPTPRRQNAAQRRKLVISDSESDDDDSAPGPSQSRNLVDLTADSDEDELSHEDEGVRTGEESEGEGDSLGEEDERGYYDEDDSYGSLKDFIVDDEESEEYSDDNEEDEEEEVEESGRRRRREKGERIRNEAEVELDADGCEAEILHYSPAKRPLLVLPNIEDLTIASSDSDTDPELDRASGKGKGRTTKPNRIKKALSATKPSKSRDWPKQRVRLAQEIFDELDTRVFESRLGSRKCNASAGAGAGARIEWNKRLLTTAGVARSKRTRHPDGSGGKEFWIELSEKVLTGKEQILNTVAHEMCHLATWIINDEYKNPHGRVFKSWGRKVMRARKDIEVTTTHAYVIEYKYKWKCSNERCGKIYQRHSKSIDVQKHACGSCKSKLEAMFESKQKASSPFQLYLKANMAFAKAAMPAASHGDVMRALSRRWTESSDPTSEAGVIDHETYWRNLADAARS